MAEPRTFKVDDPHMTGDDIKQWEIDVKAQFDAMEIHAPIKVDGQYDVADRSYTATLLHALGINATEAMKDGITPALRIKVRNRQLTDDETKRFHSPELTTYRRDLRDRYSVGKIVRVHKPVDHILADSWGYHPGVHDGLDVICEPDAVIYAMVKCRVVDVRASGWWGLGKPSNPALAAKGDGIIQVEVLESIGPFKKGQHICYGHAEKARVSVGNVIEAGTALGHSGFANAWHIHLMINDGSVGTRGVGNIDPKPFVDYAIKNG